MTSVHTEAGPIHNTITGNSCKEKSVLIKDNEYQQRVIHKELRDRYLQKWAAWWHTVGSVATSQLHGSRFTLELELLSGWSSCAPTPSVCVDFLQLLWAPPTSQKHGCRCTGYFKLPPGANECVHGVLRWTDIPLRVYSSLIPSVPRIGYG